MFGSDNLCANLTDPKWPPPISLSNLYTFLTSKFEYFSFMFLKAFSPGLLLLIEAFPSGDALRPPDYYFCTRIVPNSP